MSGRNTRAWLRWAGGFAVLAVVAAAAYGLERGHRWLKAEGRFPVKEIRVSGCVLLYEGEVLETAGALRGENLLTVDPEMVRARLLASGWIREARVQRRPPGRVLIAVEERRPWLLAPGEIARFVDRDGCLFPAGGKEERLDLPILHDPAGRARTVVPALAAAFPAGDGWFDEKVAQVSIDASGAVTLIERSRGTRARFGSGDFAGKAERLRTVLAEWEKSAEAYEELDLRYEGQAIARRPIVPPEEEEDEEERPDADKRENERKSV